MKTPMPVFILGPLTGVPGGLQFHTVNYGPYDAFRYQAEGTAIRLPAEADRERMHMGSAWLWGLLNQESRWTTGTLRKCEKLP